ncbi:MAG: polysaccharide deacetylase, partial [Thermoanaerobaculia bacterium]|nr:polysaccharide deacetylase [Thermoanaerobaculia bacterium]
MRGLAAVVLAVCGAGAPLFAAGAPQAFVGARQSPVAAPEMRAHLQPGRCFVARLQLESALRIPDRG